MQKFFTLNDLDVRGKRVLVRADFNVPLDKKTGDVADDKRIRETLPTIKFLLDKNAKVILETMTKRWTKDIILQQYIPQAQEGDKRILLLNGEPLGAVLRVHAPDDHRNNFFAGGKALPAQIDKHDQEIIQVLKPHLQKLGLYFVGIDIIGGYLIEVNVTSPTCLQEMNYLYHQTLENKVIDFTEKLVDQFRAKTKM